MPTVKELQRQIKSQSAYIEELESRLNEICGMAELDTEDESEDETDEED